MSSSNLCNDVQAAMIENDSLTGFVDVLSFQFEDFGRCGNIYLLRLTSLQVAIAFKLFDIVLENIN